MDIQLRNCPLAAALACWLAVGASAQAAEPPTPERALRIAQPVQSDVQIDMPEAADVPSDHSGTGTMNSVTGSGAPLKCGLSRTGTSEPSAPAPQVLASFTGT